jgi:beta-lactamase regulating signal transducer with metallopeptidase domain
MIDMLAMFSASDSARVLAQIYATSLLVLLPATIALVTATIARRAPAGTRALVWRAATLAVLVVIGMRLVALSLGQSAPALATWTVPDGFAAPLVALGRAQVGALAGSSSPSTMPQWILLTYLVGVSIVLARIVGGMLATRGILARARPAGSSWTALVRREANALAIVQNVRVLISAETRVPFTVGVIRPSIVLPERVPDRSATQRRALILHELAHVGAADTMLRFLARLTCAVLWFHPAVWLIASALRRESEHASDARVLEAGVRRSDYAELLASATMTLRGAMPSGAVALVGGRGDVRSRLAAIVDRDRDVRSPGRTRRLLAAALTVVVVLPAGSAQLAPSRSVLTTLMRDARWESRAYAVVGLAERPDSIAVARAAVTRDPSPRVRAWAAYALAKQSRGAGLAQLPLEPR